MVRQTRVISLFLAQRRSYARWREISQTFSARGCVSWGNFKIMRYISSLIAKWNSCILKFFWQKGKRLDNVWIVSTAISRNLRPCNYATEWLFFPGFMILPWSSVNVICHEAKTIISTFGDKLCRPFYDIPVGKITWICNATHTFLNYLAHFDHFVLQTSSNE